MGLNKTKTKGATRCLLITLTILALILTFFCVVVLYLIFAIVDVYLRWQHGTRYGGILKEIDSSMESFKQIIGINSFCIIKRNGSYEEYEKTIRKHFKKLHESCSKLTYQVESFLGYRYHLKSQVKFDDVITIVDDVRLKRENLAQYLNENYKDISFLGNQPWRLYVFKQPIEWSENNNQNEHIIVQIFRHSIGDGIAIGSLVSHTFDEFKCNDLASTLKASHTNQELTSLEDVYFYDNFFKQRQNFHRLASENYLSFYVEDSTKYAALIKLIKNKLNVGFTDVVSGCLAAALAEYAKKQRGEDIKSLKLSYMFKPIDKETTEMFQGTFDFNNISNNVWAFTINLPGDVDSKPLIESVQLCTEEGKLMKGGMDTFVATSIIKIAHLLTKPIVRYCADKANQNIDLNISNMVGFQSAAIDGNVVKAIITYPSEGLNSAFSLLMTSLDDRLQMSFSGPKSALAERSDLDVILRRMFENIDVLSKEVNEE